MTTRVGGVRNLVAVFGLLLLLECTRGVAQPAPAAVAAFERYARLVEARLAEQHGAAGHFLAGTVPGAGVAIERLPVPDLAGDGALLHHWRGTAFAPGATPADFNRLMRDFKAYPQRFGPEVVRAGAVAVGAECFQASMRVRQRHVITVVLDAGFDVCFGQLDAGHGYSKSVSTEVDEVAGAGTAGERLLAPAESHGFLWRLNSYWSYEVRDGGLALEIETVSLTRSVPAGLGWAVRPYVESIPRESIGFTLESAVRAVRR